MGPVGLVLCLVGIVGLASATDYDVVRKTIWAEGRGEPKEGQIAVAWVIKNRASLNRGYWGGSNMAAVCRHPGQFECWNGKTDIDVSSDWPSYDAIDLWLPDVMINRRQHAQHSINTLYFEITLLIKAYCLNLGAYITYSVLASNSYEGNNLINEMDNDDYLV